MKLNPVLVTEETETTFNISFLNSDTPFAKLKKGSFFSTIINYKPIIEKLAGSKNLKHSYLEEDFNYTLLKKLLRTRERLTINEMIRLSNKINTISMHYSTITELSSIDPTNKIDLLVLDISQVDIPTFLSSIKKIDFEKVIFFKREEEYSVIGPLVNNSDIICFNCLLHSTMAYENHILTNEIFTDKNPLITQIIEFFLNKSLNTNFLANGQLMIQRGDTYKTSYRVPYESLSCESCIAKNKIIKF